MKSSLQRELDSFYKEVTGAEFNIRHVTKGAFSRSRAKLKPEAFVELSDNLNATFYDQFSWLAWNNFRLLSVDGSRLSLPKHDSITKEFGEHGFGPNADSPRSLALCSILYDTLNLTTLDAQIAPYSSSERELFYKHLNKVIPGDLLLLDRGYPSLPIMFQIKAQGAEFCIRMKEDWWLEVKQFTESDQIDGLVQFRLPKKDKHLLDSHPQLGDVITCRLISIPLENGEKEILCTSLIDQEYSYDDFGELYHFRWNIEEAYKLFKCRIELENFSGKTAKAVKQDFFAKIFMMNLCAGLAFPIEEKVKQEHEKEKAKHKQKINRTAALAMTTNISVALFVKRTLSKAIKSFDDIVYRTLEIIRPNRKFERKKKPKRPYHMNYKRL